MFFSGHLPGGWTSELVQGFEYACEGAQYVDVHRCIREGLWASMNNCTISGAWHQSEGGLIISILELAVFLPLKYLQKTIEPSCACFIRQLNSGLLSQQSGGTHSFQMCDLVWRILAWSNASNIQIRARHIPGNLNVIADSLSSRDKVIQTEWSLQPLVFQKICQDWHKPKVDLLTNSWNTKLPTCISPVPDNKDW